MNRVSIVVVVFCFVASAAFAGGPIPISEPGTITESGDYVVVQDIGVADDTVLRIEAQDVTIDLDGHRLTGGGAFVVFMPKTEFEQTVTIVDGEIFGGANAVSKDAGSIGLPGTVRLENLLIQDCETGVAQDDGTIEIRNSVIRCEDESLNLRWADASIGGTIANNDLVGDVEVSGAIGLDFIHNRIAGGLAAGVDGYRSSVIEGNAIAGGIGGNFEDMTIRGNVVSGGIFVFGGPSLIEGNTLLGAGIEVFFGDATVKNNMVVGATGDGVLLTDGNAASRNTIVDGDGYGLVLNGDGAKYGGNYARGNAQGDFLDDGSGNLSRGGNYLPDAE